MNELMKSKLVQGILIVLGGLVLLSGAFAAGVDVGERKARHFNGWSQNYDRMFGDRRGFRGGKTPFGAPSLPGGHGVFGKVLSVSGQQIVVQGKDGVEQNVLVASSTAIRIGREEGTPEDIRPDAEAAVFGSPNDQGQIEARLIRIFSRP